MKGNTYTRLFLALTAIVFWSYTAMSQTTTQPAPSRQQQAVDKANANIAKTEQKIAWADSVLAVNTEIYEQMQDSIDISDANRKAYEKEYSTKRKSIEKQSQSKDKATATQALADLKALDAQYKAFIKARDTELKRYMKNSDTSSRQQATARQTKKDSQTKLKEYKKALAVAEKSLNVPAKGKK